MARAVMVAASCASLVMLGALLHTQPAIAGNNIRAGNETSWSLRLYKGTSKYYVIKRCHPLVWGNMMV